LPQCYAAGYSECEDTYENDASFQYSKPI